MEAVRASLLGVFASHALLMAFALKLKMSAALRQPDRSSRQPGEQEEEGPASTSRFAAHPAVGKNEYTTSHAASRRSSACCECVGVLLSKFDTSVSCRRHCCYC
jgi:hypothetical protein